MNILTHCIDRIKVECFSSSCFTSPKRKARNIPSPSAKLFFPRKWCLRRYSSSMEGVFLWSIDVCQPSRLFFDPIPLGQTIDKKYVPTPQSGLEGYVYRFSLSLLSRQSVDGKQQRLNDHIVPISGGRMEGDWLKWGSSKNY